VWQLQKGKNFVSTQKYSNTDRTTCEALLPSNLDYKILSIVRIVDSGGRLLFCWNGVGACLFLASFLRAYCINLFS